MSFKFQTEKFIHKKKRKILIKRLFSKIFLEDWSVKLMALAITIALWFGVTGLQAPLTMRLSRITFSPLVSSDLEITNSPVQEVDLVITGDKRKIERLNPHQLVASLDLTNIEEGERTLQINPEDVTINLPNDAEGIKIDKIQPNRIVIKLEKVEEYDVPIIAETEGDLEKGFEIYETTVIPKKVRVRGPKSFVESLNFVSTEKINITDLKSNFTAKQISFNIVNPKVTPISVVSANVFFRIGRKRIERLFVVPHAMESSSGKASVTLYGPDTVLENLSVEDLRIVEEQNEKGIVKMDVILPDNIKNGVEIRGVKYRE